ncbi:MAG: translation initiation factor IF-2 [Planctomycetota bacterium]
MSKKRIYDLAKEYGMTGKDLAAKLKDMGFTQVKSHMTALDDFEVLEVQAKLEAYGVISEVKKADEGEDLGGGLIVRRKKKRAKPDEPVEAPVAAALADEAPEEMAAEATLEEPITEEAPVEEPVPVAAAAAIVEPEAPVITPEPAVEEPVAAVEPPTETEAPAEAAPEVVAEAAPETVAPVAEAAPEPVAPVAEEPAPVAEVEAAAPTPDAAPAPEAAPEATEAAKAPAAEATPAATAAKVGAPGKPAATGGPKPAGKVVGFIDLSSIPTHQPKRPDSRRLRGANENFKPNVQPTFGRDKAGVFQRSDGGNRDDLTAAQLRDRESSRFLRRRGGFQGRGRGAGGRGRGSRLGKEFGGSPMAGKTVGIEEPITLKALADTMSIKATELLKVAFKLLGFGSVNITSLIDEETATLLAEEFEVELEVSQAIAAEDALLSELTDARKAIADEHLITRAPAVAFLGHVDHGKTTLIDSIRNSRIANTEAGGITQHIGAYKVSTSKGHEVTIVDTPGHAAFTAMRSRGASAVDVVVLVVAGDDGVMPQTREALDHARAAGTPIVVAITKSDRPESNPEKVRNELASFDLIPEDWGGATAMLQVSGITGDGVEELLERVFLESEVLELKAHAKGPASGVVLEAEIQQGKGKVAHLLVQDGSLKRGDIILAGEGYGRVRSIHNDRNKIITEAGPSMPVEVTGLNELPTVGDKFHVVDSLARAAEVATERTTKKRQMNQVRRSSVNAENLFAAVAESKKTSINLVIKTDVQGSSEVIRQQLASLLHDEIEIKVLSSSVGSVVDSDVDLASTSDATILAFQVATATKVRKEADRKGVEILNFRVLYELLDYVKDVMEGKLTPDITESVTGHVEIKRIFKSSRTGNIAGCMVLDGVIGRNSKLRLTRDGSVVFEGVMGSLRREADEAKEVREGFECGLTVKNYDNIEVGDIIETFKHIETARKLELKEPEPEVTADIGE